MLMKSRPDCAFTRPVMALAIAVCGVSPSRLVGQALGNRGALRPAGSTSGTSLISAAFGSTGQARLPVESFMLLYGCEVAATCIARAPTERLCPVPMIPVQSQGMFGV